jgi:HEPN domain-containing protein
MKPLTLEWINKAEADFSSAQRELRARKNPNFDAACFHAQQCVEKYLKACLQEAEITFGKTHDLVVLLDMILPVDPILVTYRTQLRMLSSYAIEFRYPGESADKNMARQAVRVTRSFRDIMRIRLRVSQ